MKLYKSAHIVKLFLHTGTGKSVTGAHLAYIFSRANNKLAEQTEYSVKQCVVYCGPSNKSVDVVHGKSLKYAGLRNNELYYWMS